MRKDILRAYPQLDPNKVSVVHNGIDLEAFRAADNPELVRAAGVDPDKRSVVFVGRITQQKGLPYLLKAARELPADVQLVLCAGSADTPAILQEVSDLIAELSKVRDNVIWIERQLSRTELTAVLSAATVFACPSIYEPLGIVNLEAMACGTPVVAIATGGIPEVVAHDATGILVPIEQLQDGSGKPLDESKFVADFAAALNKMLSHPQLSEFGLAGRKRVEENFSWQSIAEQTIRVYQKAIAGIA
jgi:starch synthase